MPRALIRATVSTILAVSVLPGCTATPDPPSPEREASIPAPFLTDSFAALKAHLVDVAFLDAMRQSVESRMENSDSADSASLVNTEFAYLDKFEVADLADSRLAEIRDLYLQGLSEQKTSLDELYQYNEQIIWQTGRVHRLEALKELYDEYGFMAENAEFVGRYVSAYDSEKALLDAYNAIEADIHAQNEAGAIGFDWDYNTAIMRFRNNTPYTYTTTFEFNFVDKDGNVVESTATQVEAQPNSGFTVTAYFSSDEVDNYNWVNYYNEVKLPS